MSQLYGGLITPHWNQIDAIHYGSANSLATSPVAEKVLVGRYVLVKYLEDIVYTQDDRNKIILGNLQDTNAQTWKAYYKEDGNIDCDGMVYVKTLNGFKPVARLNPTFSERFVRDAIGFDDKTVKKYVDDVDAKVLILIGGDSNKSARAIAIEEINKLIGDAPDSLDTLKEISDWIENDERGTSALITRMSTAEQNININATEIDNLQDQVDNLVYAILIEAAILPDVETVATNMIYSIPVNGENYRALYNIIQLEAGKSWNLLGYTENTKLKWQTF